MNLEPHIKKAPCPTCDAAPGHDCYSLHPGRGPQRLTHTARYMLAKRLGLIPDEPESQ